MARLFASVVVLSAFVGCTVPDGGGEAADSVPAGSADLWAAYLRGRIAQDSADEAGALGAFSAALAEDPTSEELQLRVMALATSEGRLDLALPIARNLARSGGASGLAEILLATDAVKRGNRTEAVAAGIGIPGTGFFGLAGGLIRAWTLMVPPADPDGALAEIDKLDDHSGLGDLQGALIADLAGRKDEATKRFKAALARGTAPLRLTQLAGNFFERSGDTAGASALYDRYAAGNTGGLGFTPALSTAGPPAPLVADARHGLAEALFDLASLTREAQVPELALITIRLSLDLAPDSGLAAIVLADAMEAEHRPAEALAVYRGIDPHSPLGWTARLREAALLDATGDHDGGIALLRALAAERPDRPEPVILLGDILRDHDDDRGAVEAYGEALDRVGADPKSRYWSLHFSRGVALERLGDWARAEPELRAALAARADDAAILNYLGYSLVDRGVKLDEALNLIERAVALRPRDGAYVDSLGWAYFRLRDYDKAERTLERAVELLPSDPEVTEHLGDAYWQGGRKSEARLQWRRALDLAPKPDMAKRLTAKLDHPPALVPGSKPPKPAAKPAAKPSAS